MQPEPMRYETFVLRMWQEQFSEEGSSPEWRFSLRDSSGEGRTNFVDVKQLCSFLTTMTTTE